MTQDTVAANNLPTVGAAMLIEELVDHADWLKEKQRDLELQDGFMTHALEGDWQPLVRETNAILDGFSGRLGIHGPFIDLTIVAADPKIRAVVIERHRQGLELAHELGATHMVVHSPFKFFGHDTVAHSPGHGQARDIQTAVEILGPIVADVEQAGCTLVIENILDVNSGPLLALVQAFDSNAVRMSLDTGHAFIKHQIGGPTPDQWVRDAGPHLGHVHISDNDGNLDRHWAAGDGNVHWFAVFEALAELEQSPRLIIEVRDKERNIPRATAWLAAQGLAQ